MAEHAVPLSVHILTYNRRRSIRRCIESVRWAAEVQVVDSGSTDGTLEIARELADQILEHPFEDFASQHIWGIERLVHDWVLVVDSDEWVTPELAREIQEMLTRGPRHAGYYIPRRSLYLGREIRYSGWQRDRVLRLFDRKQGNYVPCWIHEEPVIHGSVGRTRHLLKHDPYESVADHLERIRGYASRCAEQAWQENQRFRLRDLLFRPPWRIFRHYLLMQGWRDGFHGLVLSIMSSLYVFLKYLKLWEISRRRERTDPV